MWQNIKNFFFETHKVPNITTTTASTTTTIITTTITTTTASTTNILPIGVLKLILNIYFRFNFPKREQKVGEFLLVSENQFSLSQKIFKLLLVCKNWESQIIPTLNYPMIRIEDIESFNWLLKLKTKGFYKTPIQIQSIDLQITPKYSSKKILNLKGLDSINSNDTKDRSRLSKIFQTLYNNIKDSNHEIKFNSLKISCIKENRNTSPITYLKEFILICNVEKLDFSCSNTLNMFLEENTLKFEYEYTPLMITNVDWSTIEIGERIQELDLSFQRCNNLLMNGLLDFDISFKSLYSLNLTGNSLDVKSVGIISRFITLKDSNLTILNLSSNLLGSDGINQLVNNIKGSMNSITLRSLDISENNITDEGSDSISSLLENYDITSLSISSNKFTDIGLEKIFRSLSLLPQKLVSFNISNLNQNQPIESFSQFISSSKSLKKLKSKSMKTNDLNSPIEYLFQSLSFNESLVKLDLSFTNIESNYYRDLLCKFITKTGTLKSLILCGCFAYEYLSKSHITSLFKENKSIRELDLSLNNIGDNVAFLISENLKENQSITKLNLKNNLISKSASNLFETLSNGSSLILDLNLSFNKITTLSKNIRVLGDNNIVSFFENNKTLSILNLSNNYLGFANISIIIDSIIQCKTFMISLNLSNNLFQIQANVDIEEKIKKIRSKHIKDFKYLSTGIDRCNVCVSKLSNQIQSM